MAPLLPVNANEIDLAPSLACSVAQCIAARAQAKEMLRMVRQNADDIGLVMPLNAQYGSMVRTPLSSLGRLMRVQAVRQKREAIEGAASQKVVDPYAEPPQPPVPEAAPAPHMDQGIEENVSENNTNSQDTAFETRMSEQPWNQGPKGPDLSQRLREGLAESRLPGWE